MNPPVLKIKKLHPAAVLPVYATDGAACFDLSCRPNDFPHLVKPGQPHIFSTELSFEVPEGWVMLIFSRSGHGFKNDLRLANCVGVIDADYRGEVKVKLTHDGGGGGFCVEPGDRIAQAMLVQIPRPAFEVVDELGETERGAGGFGSTGA